MMFYHKEYSNQWDAPHPTTAYLNFFEKGLSHHYFPKQEVPIDLIHSEGCNFETGQQKEPSTSTPKCPKHVPSEESDAISL